MTVRKDKLIYILNTDDIVDEESKAPLYGESVRIELELLSGPTIWEFKRIIRNLALSMGYNVSSVMDAFPTSNEEEMSFDDRLRDLGYYNELDALDDFGSVSDPHDPAEIILAEIKHMLNKLDSGTDEE